MTRETQSCSSRSKADGSGLFYFVCAGSGAGRGLVTGLGAGAGAGSSWTTCQMAFAGHDEAKAALNKTDKAVGDLKDKLSGSN